MARILVVDDSIVMRRNLQTILTEGGHEIVGQAINGKQAVIAYSELKPDLVTMDISMPIMSGVDAVSHIINKDPSAKIIMISALNQKQMVFEALNNGAKHYIIKPIEPNALLTVINEVLYESDTVSVEIAEKSNISIDGFKIENVEGKFVIKFNEYLDIKDINPLETALKGLLFIKPLNIVLDFNSIKDIHSQILQTILKLSKHIQACGGSVEFKNLDTVLKEKIQEGDD